MFFIQMQSHVLAPLFFERSVRYFGSLHPAFEMSCNTEYLEKNSFWLLRKRGLRRFVLCAIVLMIFEQTSGKNLGDFTGRKTPTFQIDVEYVPKKSVWALLCIVLVVTKKYVLRTHWGLSFWNNTCFLFKCRVTFGLRQFSKVRFGTLAFYILRLRCLVISNTYKNSFCFLSKTEPFQNDIEYVPKMSVWALRCVFLWL